MGSLPELEGAKHFDRHATGVSGREKVEWGCRWNHRSLPWEVAAEHVDEASGLVSSASWEDPPEAGASQVDVHEQGPFTRRAQLARGSAPSCSSLARFGAGD